MTEPPAAHRARFTAAVASLVLAIAVSASAVETEKAVAHLLEGTTPDAAEQKFWEDTYRAWRDSEAHTSSPGDPILGNALSSLADGELPNEEGSAAILRLYNVSRSRRHTAETDQPPHPASGTHTRSQRPRNRSSYLPYLGTLLGFALALAVTVLLSRRNR